MRLKNVVCIYILKMADGEYYVGSTNNLKGRIEEHTNGRDISTKRRLPVVLEAYIAVKSEMATRRLPEKQLQEKEFYPTKR